MILSELLTLLQKIKRCQPEAVDADVWAVDQVGATHPIRFVGFDQKHKPARIKLEE
jgi:hypothetical protein